MPLSPKSVMLTAQGVALRTLYRLPARIRRLLAGPPIRVDGQELALDAQLLLRAQQLAGMPSLFSGDAVRDRRVLEESSGLVAGQPIGPMHTRDLTIGSIPARLYTPAGLPAGSPLLVYFHGGGFVIGNIESHDTPCRFLAKYAKVRVLSVDYRLAPEHRFPHAVEDAVAAFKYAHANARELGADPSVIAVGGDSAGGNLAAVVALVTTREGGPKPAFQLLLYPTTAGDRPTRSKDLFAKGFFLTKTDIDCVSRQYPATEQDKLDPRYAPALAPDLSGLPPAYLATAGFDPLRDEGELYAALLREAGVPVVLSRHDDLIHGYANFLTIGTRFREAMYEAAGSLRTALEMRSKESV
ncbi:alpha/beta hydrolase [Kibdelosporangium phytohabitans]|uniref:Alpha/beta hydrolase n=1 Tax=Kibdelosporangium phytohabitans TaxID=860235 RepID=A0A0N9IDI2_9PSEU|nr:alpha/beta hydrolase [Kibdelosporangium phytohabitans]ALG14472.1 alpha/beta hydrolase [Kibdelosporangium phytohabitans]MBE1466237.1 acetyl esterase [Kibdelosporangium phytohabitans]